MTLVDARIFFASFDRVDRKGSLTAPNLILSTIFSRSSSKLFNSLTCGGDLCDFNPLCVVTTGEEPFNFLD